MRTFVLQRGTGRLIVVAAVVVQIAHLSGFANSIGHRPGRSSSVPNFSWVRGVNYIPSHPASVSWDFLSPAELYDRPTIQRELGWARGRLRLNALRVRASPNAFAKDPHTFVRNLHDFVGLAAAEQLHVMPVLFDTGDLLKPLSNASALERYLDATVRTFAANSTVMGWDLCNECYFPHHDDADKRKALEEIALRTRKLRGPGQFVTTGMGEFGRWPHEAEQAQYVDVVSFHSCALHALSVLPLQQACCTWLAGTQWCLLVHRMRAADDGNQSDMAASLRQIKALAAAAHKPLAFASEISNRPWDPICGDIDVLKQQGLGWFAWELMVSHSGWGVPKCPGCPIYQGLLYPNGSAFSEEELSCVVADGRVLWLPLLPSLPPPPPAAVLGGRTWPHSLTYSSSITGGGWVRLSGGNPAEPMPWKLPPLRGEGGMRVTTTAPTAPPATTAAAAAAAPSLELAFTVRHPLAAAAHACLMLRCLLTERRDSTLAGLPPPPPPSPFPLCLSFCVCVVQGTGLGMYMSTGPGPTGGVHASVLIDGRESGVVSGYTPTTQHARYVWIARNLSRGLVSPGAPSAASLVGVSQTGVRVRARGRVCWPLRIQHRVTMRFGWRGVIAHTTTPGGSGGSMDISGMDVWM
jgi:hypothetical protein